MRTPALTSKAGTDAHRFSSPLNAPPWEESPSMTHVVASDSALSPPWKQRRHRPGLWTEAGGVVAMCSIAAPSRLAVDATFMVGEAPLELAL